MNIINREFKRTFIALTIMSLITISLMIFVMYIPTVYFNYEHNSCVKVESYNPNHDCENLPKRYNHKFTKGI